MSLTILVVDDNEMNRDILARRLEKENYKVITANNGQEALDLLTIQAPDAMLLDIMMPVMDGYEVLDRMKESSKTNSIPIMMVTAVNDMQTVVKCIKKGAADYITKPFETDLLKARVERMLARSKAKPVSAQDMTEPMAGHVLVVDDVDLNRDVLARRLKEYGLTVTAVNSGPAALDAVTQTQFDLIILDIMMPEMDGFQVLEQLKKNKNTKHIPVLMISALDDQASIKKALQMGAADYVVKPFDNVLLRARVRSFLGFAKKSQPQQVDVAGWMEKVKRAVMSGSVELPVVTDIATTVAQLSADPSTPMEEIAKVIEMDPSMTAKLLTIANSSFYKGTAKVNKIIDAMTRIGLQETRHYVTTIAHRNAFNCNMKSTGRVMESVWLHSLASAVVAQKLAQLKGHGADEVYTWALLHDIGMAVAIRAIEASEGSAELSEDDVTEIVVPLHEELGAGVLGSWQMDARLVDFVSCHHASLDSAQDIQLVLACAEELATRAGFGCGDPPRENFDQLWQRLAVGQDAQAIAEWAKNEMEKVKSF